MAEGDGDEEGPAVTVDVELAGEVAGADAGEDTPDERPLLGRDPRRLRSRAGPGHQQPVPVTAVRVDRGGEVADEQQDDGGAAELLLKEDVAQRRLIRRADPGEV